MNVLQFLTLVEKHYGQYKDELALNYIKKYITDKFKGGDLSAVFNKLKQNFSTKWRCPPDEAVFQEIFFADNFEIKAMLAWNSIRKVSALESIMCVDPVIHITIESGWGNWPDFVHEREKENKWCRKLFVELYQKFANNFPAQYKHSVLLGMSDQVNQHNHIGIKKIVRIGDAVECDKLLKVYFEKRKKMPGRQINLLAEKLKDEQK